VNAAAGAVTGSLALRFAGLSFALLLLAGLGFWPRYLSRSWSDIDAHTHVHAVFGVTWLVLLIAQPLLFRARRMRAHRILGRAAIPVASGFVVSSVLLMHARFSGMSPEAFSAALPFLSLPVSMTLLFTAAVLLALIWRGVPSIHARFMAASALSLVDPALARAVYFLFPPLPAEWMYQATSFAVVAAALLVMLVSLPSNSRGRPAFQAFTAAALVMLGLLFVVPGTEAWRNFAYWFRGLPLS
jgi:hypothetical protein